MEEVLRFWVRIALREEEESVFEECVLSHLRKGMAFGDLSGLDESYKAVYLFPQVLAAILRVYNLEVFQFLRLLGAGYLDALSDLDLSLVNPTDDDLKGIAETCKSLTICKLNTCSRFGDDGFLALLSVLGECEDLDLGGCWGISSEVFGEIALACPELKRLDVRECRQIRPKDFKRLFSCLEEIRYLNVGQCPGIDDGALKILGKKARCLENLNLRECIYVGSHGVESLDALPLRKLELSGCVQVESSSLIGRKFIPELVLLNLSRCPLITDAAVVDLVQRARALRALTLKQCSLLSGAAVHALGGVQAPLEALDLSYNPQIPERGIQSFFEQCGSLHSCSLKGCIQITNTLCLRIADYNPHMRYLNVSLCPQIDDEGVLGLSRLKDLHCLYLHQCGNIGDNSLRSLVSKCLSLEELDVSFSVATDAFLIDLAQHASSLKSLWLSHCNHISDKGIQEIAEHAPYLERLSLAECPHITARAMQAMAQHLRYLQELYLGEKSSLDVEGLRALIHAHFPLEELELPCLEEVDDTLLKELVKAYPLLTKLSLASCGRITDSGIAYVAKYCQYLVEVDLSGCGAVTQAGVEELLLKCQSLKMLNLQETSVTEAAIQELIEKLHRSGLRVFCSENTKTIRAVPLDGHRNG